MLNKSQVFRAKTIAAVFCMVRLIQERAAIFKLLPCNLLLCFFCFLGVVYSMYRQYFGKPTEEQKAVEHK